MFIGKNSLIVNNINLGNYIVEARYGYNKLWSSDSGRNLAGTQSGTLIGIFPKIIVQFRKLTQAELEALAPILDSARQTVKYYDPNKKTMTTMTTKDVEKLLVKLTDEQKQRLKDAINFGSFGDDECRFYNENNEHNESPASLRSRACYLVQS